jgi:proline dehydrogenase
MNPPSRTSTDASLGGVVPGPSPVAGTSGPPRSLLPDAIAPELPAPPDPLRAAITAAWAPDEAAHLSRLLEAARLADADRDAIQAAAADLVRRVRARAADQGAIEAFMRQYDLGSEEGVLLMCVAEALLRIPDQDTADRLIRDKLGEADWQRHMGQSDSVLVNASTWGLMLTGHLVDLGEDTRRDVRGAFRRMVGRVGEPVIRLAVRQAMRIMGHQFVMGRTIDEALARSRKGANAAYRYSFDMLGEAALTAHDAQRYLQAYREAIAAIGRASGGPAGNPAEPFGAPSISVKLSALHPRYEHAKRARVLAELAPRVLELARLAKAQGIGFTVDAEEADRLEVSLDVFAAAYADPSLDGWEGCGLAVQAYQKRAPAVIDYVVDLARRHGRRIPLRLVKGAYWDSEVKRAQVDGYEGYPVFTRKPNTDVSYLACARRMFEATDALYPMFATHNAHTIAAIHRMASLHLPPAAHAYEFQKLHGMGDDLYAEVIPADRLGVPCRVYAPVGSHEDLLPYLVRRLLENGANSSFVNRITDEQIPVEDLVRDPVETVAGFVAAGQAAHPRIPLPVELFRSQGHERGNSMGINLANDDRLRETGRTGQRRPARRLERRAAGAGRTLVRGHGRGDQPGRPSPPGRALAAGRRRHRRARARQRGRRARGLERHPGRQPRRDPRARRRPAGTAHAAVHRAVHARGRKDHSRRNRGSPRGRRLPALLRAAGTRAVPHRAAARPDRREQHPAAVRARGVRVHQPVELPAGDLHRPGGRGACGRQRGAGQAGRADQPGRVLRGAAAARGRRAARRAAAGSRRRRQRRRQADLRPAGVGRGIHRRHRYRAPDQPRIGRAHRGARSRS